MNLPTSSRITTRNARQPFTASKGTTHASLTRKGPDKVLRNIKSEKVSISLQQSADWPLNIAGIRQQAVRRSLQVSAAAVDGNRPTLPLAKTDLFPLLS